MIASRLSSAIGIILLLGLAMSSYAQEPAVPYVLSEGVQSRAKQLNLWSQVTEGLGKVLEYLDVLTAADIIVRERLKFQNRAAPSTEDYDIAFASECTFVPNKPRTNFLMENSPRVRQAIGGIYLRQTKRDAFAKALSPFLLKTSKEELFKALEGIKAAGDYEKSIINVRGF